MSAPPRKHPMNKLCNVTLLAISLCAAALPTRAQSTDLRDWRAAGDVSSITFNQAVLTTAALDSGESPRSADSALLFDALEAALNLVPGTLAADTFEGSAIHQQFVLAPAGAATIRFDWSLSTIDFDAGFIDRAFVLIDGGGGGGSLLALGEAAASPVSNSFRYTFASEGNHSFAVALLDVGDTIGVSTLVLSHFTVTSAVPEPGSMALLLAGLVLIGGRVGQRRCMR